VKYRPEILSLYGDIFDDTHQALTKEARVPFSKRIVDFLRRGKTLRAAESRAVAGEAAAARKEQAVQDALHRMQQLEFDKKLLERQLGTATKELGAAPGALSRAQLLRNIGLGGTAVGAAGIPLAYSMGKDTGEAKQKRTRNLAFGAGAAAGMAAPHIIKGLGQIARGAGQTGLFPEFQTLGQEAYTGSY